MKHRRLLILSLLIVALLVGGCCLWVWQARRQCALNRQLVAALENNDTNQALVLVNAGADPDTRYNPPPAPTLNLLLMQLLHCSTVPADNSPTAFMLASGAFYKQPENAYDPQLRRKDDPQLVQAMLTHGANLHALSAGKSTALRGAVCLNYKHVAELLLKQGANVNEQYANGWTPLMESVWHGDRNMVRLLLAYGANVNVQKHDGRTALHFSMLLSIDKNIVVQLRAHGADPHLHNKHGFTALTLAQEQHRSDIVALLCKGQRSTRGEAGGRRMEPKMGKRIVSPGEYVQGHGKRAGLGLLGACLSFLAFLFAVSAVGDFITALTHISRVYQGLSGGLAWGGLAYLFSWMGKRSLGHFHNIDPGVPFTHANTAHLPSGESLVRASSEPMQAQQAVLLRAAAEGQETPPEQLVRAVER